MAATPRRGLHTRFVGTQQQSQTQQQHHQQCGGVRANGSVRLARAWAEGGGERAAWGNGTPTCTDSKVGPMARGAAPF